MDYIIARIAELDLTNDVDEIELLELLQLLGS